MADNVPITAGTGTNVATDDIGGVHYQRIKVTFGTDGTATDVSATNPLPIAGSIASGATDSGNPIKVGGKVYTPFSNLPALTNGQRSDMVLNTYGSQYVQLTGAFQNPIDTGVANNDTQAGGSNTLPVTGFNHGYNDATSQWKRVRVEANGVLITHNERDNGATFRGRAATFRTPGRAGTAGQKIFALHNATGSTKVVRINQIAVDLAVTAVKAVTVLPPLIRIGRFTAVPTNGTVLTKTAKDTSLSSNSSITVWGDASADGTGSATTLTVTTTANWFTQEYAPRLVTAVGYEPFDRSVFLEEQDIVLRPLEGIVVFLDYTLATQNPVTDMWAVTCDWSEF